MMKSIVTYGRVTHTLNPAKNMTSDYASLGAINNSYSAHAATSMLRVLSCHVASAGLEWRIYLVFIEFATCLFIVKVTMINIHNK